MNTDEDFRRIRDVQQLTEFIYDISDMYVNDKPSDKGLMESYIDNIWNNISVARDNTRIMSEHSNIAVTAIEKTYIDLSIGVDRDCVLEYLLDVLKTLKGC